ncbi:poly-gamma-glutamate synthase PgsB [Actinomycetospora chibensis]|uniref:Poly-gamma-glutamate synthase PgsB n=1 Tax=Actinomycetospora chibensis TaxID=663606 RepID=A0ABV9RJK9_9PSEU|nr:poly-gamma-glutamate synthase PgsB [Actinomycetospora chibensis]MDD7926103.1 poly-gamma-glutamate synthase PgsB [Actinomycetospora chibensis]
MGFLFTIYAIGCLLLLVAGVNEQRRHLANLHSIPSRIVINGIRGKSSITRLCAGALRGGGQLVVAKTTGTAARFISPDGEDEPIYRKFGLANIVEQIDIVRRAAAYRPDALVIECMAVLPDLQEVNERKLIQSTVCVICNVREDHLTEMGPTLDDVARSLSRSMPIGGVCITAEQDRVHILRDEAERRGCRLIQVDPESVSNSEIERFPWITFKENVAIAIAVAALSGVDRSTALEGMIASRPDPGTVAVSTRDASGRTISFANIFAANDPESTMMNVELLASRGLIGRPLNVVINCRPDRIERNGQMGELTARLNPDKIIIIGEQTRSARAAIPTDIADRVEDLGGALDFIALIDSLKTDTGGAGSLVAVGNIHGQGEVLLDRLRALPAAPAHTAYAPLVLSQAQSLSSTESPAEPKSVARAPLPPNRQQGRTGLRSGRQGGAHRITPHRRWKSPW